MTAKLTFFGYGITGGLNKLTIGWMHIRLPENSPEEKIKQTVFQMTGKV